MLNADARDFKKFNVFEDTRFDVLKRVKFLPTYEFDFHTTEERLHYVIVSALTSYTHTA